MNVYWPDKQAKIGGLGHATTSTVIGLEKCWQVHFGQAENTTLWKVLFISAR